MVIYIEVMDENLIMWKDEHRILLYERNWLLCELILEN